MWPMALLFTCLIQEILQAKITWKDFFFIPERDHSDINKDPFFKDFKKYVASKVLLEKAKEKVKDCCGPSVVKTVDGQGSFCSLVTHCKKLSVKRLSHSTKCSWV